MTRYTSGHSNYPNRARYTGRCSLFSQHGFSTGIGILCTIMSLQLSTTSSIAQETVPSDSLQSDLFMMADSLNARYAGQGAPVDDGPPSQGIAGRFRFGRSLSPLNHHGDNVFQDVVDTPRLINAIRRLKSNFTWSPYDPGQSGNTSYDYLYNQDGAEKASYFARLFFERPLSAETRVGYRFEGRYDDLSGPFPNQHASDLDVHGRVTYRISPSLAISFDVLGMDNGWHFNRGNSVYTDRARYMLEQLNTWRARTGGLELTWKGMPGPRVSYRIYSRVLTRQWASDPPDPALLRLPSPGDILPVTQPQPAGVLPEDESFINNIYPVVSTAVSTSKKTMRSIENGAELTYQISKDNLITVGVESQFHRKTHFQHWQTSTILDRFDLAVQPREISLYFSDQFRFWRLMMATGLRYDLYQPGSSSLSNVIRTTIDPRVAQEPVRQLLLSTGGLAKTTHLLNPYFSVAYPSNNYTAHMNFGISSRSLTLADRYSRLGTTYADYYVSTLIPRRTTSLEVGVGSSRSDYTADVTWFYRDTERYEPMFGPDVLPQALSNYAGSWGRINRGWHRQQGVEASYVRRSTPVGGSGIRLSGRLSYLYLFNLGDIRRRDLSIAPGQPVNPGDLTTFDARVNDFWNRRHWIAMNASLRLFSGATFTMVGHLQSGVPYLGSRKGVSGTWTQDVLFGPWMRRFDGRVDIPIRIGRRSTTLLLFFEGRNLTDRTIVDVITDPVSFENTGQPDNNTVSQTQWVYGPARSIWTGVGINW